MRCLPHVCARVGGLLIRYGPFWISATVSLTLFVVSNIAGFLTAWLAPAADGRQVWVYDFAVLFSSFSTMLGYVVGAAALLWFALKWLGQVIVIVQFARPTAVSTMHGPACFEPARACSQQNSWISSAFMGTRVQSGCQ